MTDILNYFDELKKFSVNLRHQIKLFYVFDDYMGKNYIYLTGDDQCYAFGSNHFGCLGFGHKDAVEAPRLLSELSYVNLIEFYKGSNFMIGQTEDKEIYVWGQNELGQLGLGFQSSKRDYIKPIINQYLSGKDIAFISCGHKHVIALSANGQVYSWGDNTYGQIGCGSELKIIDRPAELTSLSGDMIIKTTVCGDNHSMAVTIDNFVFSWGDNQFGQLGTGDYLSSNLPRLIDNSHVKIMKIICSKSSTYFLSKEGSIYYCGLNYVQGNTSRVNSLQHLKCNSNFMDILCVDSYYIRLAKTDGCVYELMKSDLSLFETKFKNLDQYFIESLHITHKTLSIDECSSQLNEDTIEDILDDHLNLFPHHLIDIIKYFHVFDDINGKNCIYVTNEDKVFAYGSNAKGILGIGTHSPAEAPVLIKGISGNGITKFYHGSSFMFAKNEHNEIFCWGNDDQGQLGLGYWGDYVEPEKNKMLTQLNLFDISCGSNHSIALTRSGYVYGWGANDWGQLGCGRLDQFTASPLKIEIFIPIKSISCGENHSMVLTKQGSVYSWGKNEFGQLGHYGCDNEIEPNQILMNNVKSIACGQNNSFLLTNYGDVNAYGQIVSEFNASTSMANINLPKNVPDAELIVVNNSHLAIRIDDAIYELKRSEETIRKYSEKSCCHSYTICLADKYGVTNESIFVNNYDMIGLLGIGSYGRVYKCKDKNTKMHFALKKLSCQGLNTKQMNEIICEFNALSNLQCDYLVQIYKTSIEKQRFMHVHMEYLDHNLIDLIIAKTHAFGRNFKQSMSNLEHFITHEIFKEIVNGLDYLHNLKPPIIHKNLKTTNILISNTSKNNKNFIKIGDYGYAHLNDLGLTTFNLIPNLTKYTALEVTKGRKYGLKSDIYSLGMIGEELYEVETFSRIKQMEIIKINPERHENIRQLIQVMQLSPKWWQRPGCSDILHRLNELSVCHKILKNEEIFEDFFNKMKTYPITFFYEFVKNKLQIA